MDIRSPQAGEVRSKNSAPFLLYTGINTVHVK
jgi:hypothetical protein